MLDVGDTVRFHTNDPGDRREALVVFRRIGRKWEGNELAPFDLFLVYSDVYEELGPVWLRVAPDGIRDGSGGRWEVIRRNG